MRALVFGAGGAFGAYEAGVWQALEEADFQPEIVVGASIGAVNAAAVARGCPARRLQEWWRDPESNVLRWNHSFRLEARIRECLAEFPPERSAARLFVTVTELPTGKIRVVEGEQVTVEALLASCALPMFFPPVRLNGRWTVDGGVFCRLPARVAADAGATEIVTVDLLAAPPSRILRGLMRLIDRGSSLMDVPPGIDVIRVESPKPLGSLLDTMRWNPGNVNRWIEQGYRDALRALQTSAAQPSRPRVESAAPR